MIDRHHIGHSCPPSTVRVEAGFLKLFAKATDEPDPIYHNEHAARAAGHRDIPAMPTYGTCLLLNNPAPTAYLEDLGVNPQSVLHAEQTFFTTGMIYAGDDITLHRKVTDIYDKKDGALEFVEWETQAVNQFGETVLTMRVKGVIRHDL